MSEIPAFSYYDAAEGGSLVHTAKTCACCNLDRGLTYAGPVLGDDTNSAGPICPWCIADGTAASHFGISFNSSSILTPPIALAPARLETFLNRTPGFNTYQQPIWFSCCDDACRFHGDLSIHEANDPDWNAVERFMTGFDVPDFERSMWFEMMSDYQVGDPAMLKFSCSQCSSVFYHLDPH